MADVSRRRFFYGWVVLGAGWFAYALFSGVGAYAPAVIMPAMFLAMGWPRGDASAPVSIGAWLMALLYPAVGLAINRFGARTIITIGGVGLGVVWLLLSQVSEMWQWFVLRGFVWAFFYVLGGPLPFQTFITQWFNLRRGFAMGVLLTGAAVGGLIAPTLLAVVMEAAKSWQAGWAWSSSAFFLTGLIAVVLIRSRPSDVGQYPDGLTPEEAQRAREAALTSTASARRLIARTYRSPINWTLRDALRTRAAWLTALTWWSGSICFQMFQVHSVLHIRGVGYTAIEGALTVSIFNVLGTPMRFIMGWMTDRIESRFVMALGLALAVIGFSILWVLPPGTPILLYAYAVVWGLGFGLIFPALSVQVGNYFGSANFAPIYAFTISLTGGLIGGLAPIGAGYIYDAFNSYGLAFAITVIVAVIAAIGSCMNTPPRPKEVAP